MTTTPETLAAESFTPDQIDSAIKAFIDFGEQTAGSAHQGYFSGPGFAARALRYHREALRAQAAATTQNRPDNFDFAMDFLGEPESTGLLKYIEGLEALRAQGVQCESVLIDGIAYAIPAPVAGEMLRLHIELQSQPSAVPDGWSIERASDGKSIKLRGPGNVYFRFHDDGDEDRGGHVWLFLNAMLAASPTHARAPAADAH